MEDPLPNASCRVWRGTVLRVCESVILSRLFKLVSYVSRMNVSLEYIVCNRICRGQVKTTLKLPSIKKSWNFDKTSIRNAPFEQPLEGAERDQSGVPVVHIKTMWKRYKHRLTVLQVTIKVMWLVVVKSLIAAGFGTSFRAFPQKITKIFYSVL